MKTTIYSLLFIGVSIFLVQSCTEKTETYKVVEPTLPSAVAAYANLDGLTAEYKSTLSAEKKSMVTNHGATLGRVLFYDEKMSLNNSTACGTCHLQEKAFADGKKLSIGFSNEKTLRNSPAIINLIKGERFFWDARSETLTDMVLNPVQDHIEMGLEKLGDLEVKLAATNYYPALFEAAYGSKQITRDRIADALSQFLVSMSSTRSKFDEGSANNFANFTEEEKRGRLLFEEIGCNNCHGGLDFKAKEGQNLDQANVGLDFQYADQGMGEGVFKIPSLRNIELTAPYMHDGRFATLEAVVDHYSNNMVAHPNLDDRLKTDNPGSGSWNGGGSNTGGGFLMMSHLNLNPSQKAEIVAFLKTLTDNALITDDKFSDPFQN